MVREVEEASGGLNALPAAQHTAQQLMTERAYAAPFWQGLVRNATARGISRETAIEYLDAVDADARDILRDVAQIAAGQAAVKPGDMNLGLLEEAAALLADARERLEAVDRTRKKIEAGV